MFYMQFGELVLVISNEFVSQFAELNVVIFNNLTSVRRTDPRINDFPIMTDNRKWSPKPEILISGIMIDR